MGWRVQLVACKALPRPLGRGGLESSGLRRFRDPRAGAAITLAGGSVKPNAARILGPGRASAPRPSREPPVPPRKAIRLTGRRGVPNHGLGRGRAAWPGDPPYKREDELEEYARNGGMLEINSRRFAESLLLKRRSFKHESEVRLIHFGDAKYYAENGLYRYAVKPHDMITQIMADPNRDRTTWLGDKEKLRKDTGYHGEIKRSKIYDPPEWDTPTFHS